LCGSYATPGRETHHPHPEKRVQPHKHGGRTNAHSAYERQREQTKPVARYVGGLWPYIWFGDEHHFFATVDSAFQARALKQMCELLIARYGRSCRKKPSRAQRTGTGGKGKDQGLGN
jgi:hypothetical protein